MKKIFITAVFILLVGGILVFIYSNGVTSLLVGQRDATNESDVKTQQTDKTGTNRDEENPPLEPKRIAGTELWETYNDASLGIAFLYPSMAYIQKSDSIPCISLSFSMAPRPPIETKICRSDLMYEENPTKETLERWLKGNDLYFISYEKTVAENYGIAYGDPSQYKIKTSFEILAGYPSVRFSKPLPPKTYDQWRKESIYILLDNALWNITYSYNETDGAIASMVEKMLSSIDLKPRVNKEYVALFPFNDTLESAKKFWQVATIRKGISGADYINEEFINKALKILPNLEANAFGLPIASYTIESPNKRVFKTKQGCTPHGCAGSDIIIGQELGDEIPFLLREGGFQGMFILYNVGEDEIKRKSLLSSYYGYALSD